MVPPPVDDQRPFRLQQKRGGGADAFRLAAKPRARAGSHVVRELDILQQDVARQIQVDRAGFAVAGDRKGLAQHVRNEIRAIDAFGPFRHRAKHKLGIDFLAGAPKGRCGGAATGEYHHRQGADESLGDVGHQIGRTGPGGDEADRGLARQLRIGRRHACRRLFVTDEKMADLGRVVEAVIDRQHVAAPECRTPL